MKKKLFFYLALGFLAVSCSNDSEDLFTVKDSTYSNNKEFIDSTETNQIIPIEESPYKKRAQTRSYGYSNDNYSFFDIRELDVNIIVRENAHNSQARYLTSNGVQKEVSLSAKK